MMYPENGGRRYLLNVGKHQQTTERYIPETLFLIIITLLTLTHGAEPFLRSRKLYRYSRTSRILWNPQFHYRAHKGPPMVPILSTLKYLNVLYL
jgi:hypothetical protein